MPPTPTTEPVDLLDGMRQAATFLGKWHAFVTAPTMGDDSPSIEFTDWLVEQDESMVAAVTLGLAMIATYALNETAAGFEGTLRSIMLHAEIDSRPTSLRELGSDDGLG